jgi:hypothetical protein
MATNPKELGVHRLFSQRIADRNSLPLFVQLGRK